MKEHRLSGLVFQDHFISKSNIYHLYLMDVIAIGITRQLGQAFDQKQFWLGKVVLSFSRKTGEKSNASNTCDVRIQRHVNVITGHGSLLVAFPFLSFVYFLKRRALATSSPLSFFFIVICGVTGVLFNMMLLYQ